MKKNIKSLIILASVSLTQLSCQRDLDILPEGAPVESTFWTTAYELESGANAMYRPLFDSEFYGRGMFWFINASDDMVTGRKRGESDNVKNFSSAYIGAGDLETQWAKRYQVIFRANQVIRNINRPNIKPSLRDKYLGEALFMSSRMYFELASNYGDNRAGIPIVDRNKEDISPIPRAKNVTKNYEFIISDLKRAVELLPYFSQLSPDEYGRPHKVAAMALLSKVYLFMEDWKNAEFWANEVITKGNRSLMPKYADVFKAENNYGSEYIWSVVSTPKFGAWGSILPGVMLENKGWGKYNGWGYFHPTKELYDEYEPNDTRRNVTLLKTGDKFIFDGEERIYQSNNSVSGYQFNKYMDAFKYPLNSGHVSDDGDYPNTDFAVPLMRYAEVILIAAEAKIMQGKSATTELDMIRRRAGLSPKTTYTLADLKHERRCELAGEWADRHRDLVRWKDAQVQYAKPLHGMDGKEIWPARNFNPNVHHIWAVPQIEIIRSNGVIKQNAGW